MHPTGGLARRAKLVADESKEGPTLVVDAGDALFKTPNLPPDPKDKKKETDKAALLLESMAKMGYAAMAVGERDAVYGVKELKDAAAKNKLTLLAANLLDESGKPVFGDKKLVTVGGVKVGVFAVVGPNPTWAELKLKAEPAEQYAQKLADALRKEGAQVVVALMHMEYDPALKLANTLKNVDFAVQSHDGRSGGTQLVGTTTLAGGGERGRLVGRAKLGLKGALPYFDLSETGNVKEQLGFVEQNIKNVEARIKAEPNQKAAYENMLTNFKKRREELTARLNAKAPEGRRTLKGDMVAMDENRADDPAMLKLVQAYTAKYGPTNPPH